MRERGKEERQERGARKRDKGEGQRKETRERDSRERDKGEGQRRETREKDSGERQGREAKKRDNGRETVKRAIRRLATLTFLLLHTPSTCR